MKKILTIIVAICLIASVICITAFAADAPAAGVVLRVSALKKDGTTTVVIEDYKSFEDGWNAAMELADNRSEMKKNSYDRIVVDLYADWNAVDGQFTEDLWNGAGFNWDAIYFQNGVRMTLNMNGHTINRGLTTDEKNGEVMYIDKDADVIINNGKITGGFSNNGAGGIHISDNARVTLNNVNVDGNAVKGDDGAGIALYNGAILTMNGGSISRNCIDRTYILISNIVPYGALYVNNSTAILNKVTISDNDALFYASEGVAIYAKDSTVTMKECTVSGNALDKKETSSAQSVIAAYNSTLNITDTDFIGNANPMGIDYSSASSHLFHIDGSNLVMNGGKIIGNNPDELFDIENTDGELNNITITDNGSLVIQIRANGNKVTMTKCVLGNNTSDKEGISDIRVSEKGSLVMNDCTIGDTTFNDKGKIDFGNGAHAGSIFGEGSITNILVIISLVASGVSIFLTVYYNKKKSAPVAANNTKSEDEE